MFVRRLAKFVPVLPKRAIPYRITRTYPRGSKPLPHFIDPIFRDLHARRCVDTMVPWQVLQQACLAAKYIAKSGIPGNLVEYGVWRGGCAILMAETLAHYGDLNRGIYLFDTHEGIPEPRDDNVSHSPAVPALTKCLRRRAATEYNWCVGPEGVARANVARCSYPNERFRLVKGMVEGTMPASASKRIALLRLDTDWYQSTRHEMLRLFPRLPAGEGDAGGQLRSLVGGYPGRGRINRRKQHLRLSRHRVEHRTCIGDQTDMMEDWVSPRCLLPDGIKGQMTSC